MPNPLPSDSHRTGPLPRNAVLALLLGLATAVLHAVPGAATTPPREAPQGSTTTATAEHRLDDAVYWAHGKRYSFALAHLHRIDPELLDAGAAARYAQLIGHIATRRPRTHGLAALVRHCSREPLRRLPACAEARARWLLAHGRAGEALAVWQTRIDGLQDDPETRRKVVGAALFFLDRAGNAALARDLTVQRGALWRFLDQIPGDSALRHDAEIMLAVARLALKVDPESERTEVAIERAVVAHGADPRALAVRGDLASVRGSWDRALPWYVWAAYTSSAHRNEDFADHWTKLSHAYQAIGWPQHAVEAADRAAIPRQTPFPKATARESGTLSSCRAWHDWLIAYEPETLVRAHGIAWSRTIEDLAVWHEQCAMAPEVPSCANPQRRGPRVPLRALSSLRERWRELHQHSSLEDTIGESLLCVVRQSTLLAKPVIDALDGRGVFPSYGSLELVHARALVQARTGRLAGALETWGRGFPFSWHRVDPDRVAPSNLPPRMAEPSAESEQLHTVLTVLSSLDSRQLRGERDAVRDFVDRWRARIEIDPQGGRLAVARARLERRLDPVGARTRQAVEDAVILSAGGAEALALRGSLELDAERPALALPWLIWAQDHDEQRSGPSTELVAAYTALGWWRHADALFQPEDKELVAGFDPARALPDRLPAACKRLAHQLVSLELGNAIARHGRGWETALRPYRDWQSTCTSSDRPTGTRAITG